MTNEYQEVLDDLNYANQPETKRGGQEYRDRRDNLLCEFVELNIETIRKALELAIALQPKPISEANKGEPVLLANKYGAATGFISVLDNYPKQVCLLESKPPTHFYDISALPKPEVSE